MTAATTITAQNPEIQYSHSLKMEDTVKELHTAVHFYAHDGEAIEEAFNTYLKAMYVASGNRIPLAPVDTGDNNSSKK